MKPLVIIFILTVVICLTLLTIWINLNQSTSKSFKESYNSNNSNSSFKNMLTINDNFQMSTLEFPKGMITPYYPPDPYNIVAPKGWSICDGTNGTPDLRGRFIRGYDFENSAKFDSVGGKDGYFITDENQKK